MNIVDEMKGKKILIWGYGREGQSTERFLKNYCNVATIDIYEGTREGIDEEKYDLIVKSPGIVMHEDHPKYTSQTEIFLKQFSNQVIGITGTKGKSTTSTLMYAVLKECCNRNVLLLGNIGQPCLDYYGEIDENTIIVFEMSCHQLAHAKTSPHIGIFLNIFEEHLDYYGTVEKYVAAKCNIAKYQKQNDYFICGENVPEIETNAKTIRVVSGNEEPYPLKVIGEHNQYNAKFVDLVTVELLHCDRAHVLKSMSAFQGLPHRLEFVGTVEGVSYYDDSISTIPEATINAISSVPNAKTVLVGGMDRNINYDILVEYIREKKDVQFICMYESGKRVYEAVGMCENCYYVADLKEAVQLAKQITTVGNACILSPAAASYGYFKNFEDRGNVFKQYVME